MDINLTSENPKSKLKTYFVDCQCSRYNWTRRPLEQGCFMLCRACGIKLDDYEFTVSGEYPDELSDIGDLMPMKEYLACCDCGGFIDYDGFGHPVKDGKMNGNMCLSPSMRNLIPPNATHMLWFNR